MREYGAHRVSQEDVEITLAVLGSLRGLPRGRLVEYVRADPSAGVRQFCDEILLGVELL